MKDINSEIGFKIIVIREQQGLSQEKLAAKAGLHHAYLCQISRYLFDIVNKSIHNNPYG